MGARFSGYDDEETKTEDLGTSERDEGGLLNHALTIIDQGEGGSGTLALFLIAGVAIIAIGLILLCLYCTVKQIGCFKKWRCCCISSEKDPEQQTVIMPNSAQNETTNNLMLKLLLEEKITGSAKAKDEDLEIQAAQKAAESAMEEAKKAKREAEEAKAAQKRAEEQMLKVQEEKKRQEQSEKLKEVVAKTQMEMKLKSPPPPPPSQPITEIKRRENNEICQQIAINERAEAEEQVILDKEQEKMREESQMRELERLEAISKLRREEAEREERVAAREREEAQKKELAKLRSRKEEAELAELAQWNSIIPHREDPVPTAPKLGPIYHQEDSNLYQNFGPALPPKYERIGPPLPPKSQRLNPNTVNTVLQYPPLTPACPGIEPYTGPTSHGCQGANQSIPCKQEVEPNKAMPSNAENQTVNELAVAKMAVAIISELKEAKVESSSKQPTRRGRSRGRSKQGRNK